MDIDVWIQGYYRDPRPHELGELVQQAAREKHLKGQRMPGLFARMFSRRGPLELDAWVHEDTNFIAFCAAVFAGAPHVIASVVADAASLPEAQQRSVWMAAWSAGAPAELLRERARATSKAAVLFVDTLSARTPIPVEHIPLNGPVVLDMLWSTFFATGEPRYIERVIEAIALLLDDDARLKVVGQSAIWSLGANARAHPLVVQTCEKVARSFDALDPLTVGGVVRSGLDNVVKAARGA